MSISTHSSSGTAVIQHSREHNHYPPRKQDSEPPKIVTLPIIIYGTTGLVNWKTDHNGTCLLQRCCWNVWQWCCVSDSPAFSCSLYEEGNSWEGGRPWEIAGRHRMLAGPCQFTISPSLLFKAALSQLRSLEQTNHNGRSSMEGDRTFLKETKQSNVLAQKHTLPLCHPLPFPI